MEDHTKQAVTILKKGGIVIFPTDTAFGIGCRIDDEEAVARLFRIRKRPHDKPTPVLVDTVTMAEKYVLPIQQDVKDKLIEAFWPGALTITLPCYTKKVPSLVRGGGKSIGVRIPNHQVTRSIIQEIGVPILGPSANFYTKPTPYNFSDLDKELVSLVDYVVAGICTIKQASTVIDCTKKPWEIIREGAVKMNPSADGEKLQLKNKKNIILSIDTSSNQEVSVGLLINSKKHVIKKKIGKKKAQEVLPMIESLLKQNSYLIKDIKAIEVYAGPGSFTGLRVGIAVANTLGLLLNIPVNGKKTGVFVEPVYE